MKKRFDFKKFEEVVGEVVSEEMTRMEAWEAVTDAGIVVPWEAFKRLLPRCKNV